MVEDSTWMCGQIVGFGFDPNTNEVHAFLASPIAGN